MTDPRQRQSEFAAAVRERANQNVIDSLPANGCSTSFRDALDYLVPPPAKPEKLLALFDGRATYGRIKHWKYGRSRPPIWAVEMICQRIKERTAPLAAFLRDARNWVTPGDGGADGARALARWRARQAEEKEKARQRAALDDSG